MSRWRGAFLLALIVPAIAALGADPEPPTSMEVDLKALKGIWKATSILTADPNGKPDGELTITFGQNKLTVKVNGQAKESTFTIDPKQKPKQIDIAYNGKTVLGIYKFEKDQLYLCIRERSKVRPKGFNEKDTDRVVLKREKK